MMNAKLGSVSLAGMILAFATIILPLCMEEPGHGQSRSFPRAEEVSRRWLTRHPRARDEAEKQIITVMDDMQDNQARGMGNVLPEDGRLMRMLTESLAAKHVVEIGTANGYSAMWFCLALRATGGRLTTHEINPQRISLARENFQRAGVDQLVTLVEGDAHETIKSLRSPIDVLLLDAEKEGFCDYLEKLLPRVRKGDRSSRTIPQGKRI